MARAGFVVREAVSISCSGPRKLKEVVGGADHRPLASDLVETTQQKLSEASGVLDLTTDGLDDLFAQAIAAAPAAPFELGGHGGDTRAAPPSFATAARVVVPGAAGGDEGIDLRVVEQDDIDAVRVEPGCDDDRSGHVLEQALGLGVAENFAGFILGAEYQTAFIFVLLVVILVWRRFWLAGQRRYLA